MANTQPIDAIVRVECTDEPLIEGRSGTNERGAWTIPTKMPVYLWQGDRYPVKLEIPVPASGRPRPGFYYLAGTPFKAEAKNNRVVISFDDRRVELVPIEQVAQLKAAS